MRRVKVSLDSLWTLRKLREDGGDELAGEASVFDRDSLRALPLGLGLHYASLTENQRAQIARRYGHQAPPVVQRAEEESRARDPAYTAATAPSGRVHRPPSSTTASSGAADGVGNGDVLLTPPLNRPYPPPPSPHSHLSPLEVVDVSPVALDVGEAISLQGAERPVVSSPRSAELHRLSLSQVDRDVLDCLPPEVRDEVLRGIASNAGGGRGGEVIGGGGGGGGGGGDEANRADHHGDDYGIHAEEGPVYEEGLAYDPGAGLVQEEDVVDVCSPSSPIPLSSQRREHAGPGGGRDRNRGDRGVFEVESAGALREALRAWVGGTVRSPSQWHLELLYR